MFTGMAKHWFNLYVQRVDANRNMARFYAMSIEPDLFGGSSLVRRWGRIGTRGKERVDLFDDEGRAVEQFLCLALQKRVRGYRPLRFDTSFPRASKGIRQHQPKCLVDALRCEGEKTESRLSVL